jgi:hypothetical protein
MSGASGKNEKLQKKGRKTAGNGKRGLFFWGKNWYFIIMYRFVGKKPDFQAKTTEKALSRGSYYQVTFIPPLHK